MLDWNGIDTVFLDMDGTLLDLHFDNHFWRNHVPQRFAEANQMDLEQAKASLYPRFKRVEGTMDWYCVDYWSRELDLDIAMLKAEVDHLISVLPHVDRFLETLHELDKRTVLVTNAHAKSLHLKMDRTGLDRYFDAIICSHDFGMPKEDSSFWGHLQQAEPFDPQATLLVDDSVPVLRSARAYGIANLRCVSEPDSKTPAREIKEFTAIRNFDEIMPGRA